MKLTTRIMMLVAAITLLMGILTIVLSGPVIKQGFETKDKEWIESLTASLAEGIALDTINGNAAHARQILEAVVRRNRELGYAYVVDFDQRLFAHTFEDGFPKKLLDLVRASQMHQIDHHYSDQIDTQTPTQQHVHSIKLKLDGEGVTDTSYPIIEGMSARLHLGLNDKVDEALVQAIYQKLVMIIFALGVFGILLAFPFSRQLTRPLERFGQLLQDYGGDKLKGQVEIPQGSSEIQRLGKAFNQIIEARSHAEDALRNISEVNQKIISESPIGIGIYDPTGQCIVANTSFAEMIGATREQALSQNYNTIKSWKKSGLLALVKKATSKRSKEQTEIYVQTTFGKTVYLDFRVVPFQMKGKTHLLLMVDDITGRKAIEDALRESEVLLERAQSLANIGYWKLNPATGEVAGSDELFRIFGMPRKEVTLEAFIEVVHPDDREMDVAAIQRGAEHGESWDIEHRIICRDGKEKWVHAIGEAVTDENGKVIELIGTVQDITKLKDAGLALYESELWMRNIYNSLDEAVLVVSPDRRVINVNDAVVNMFGYPVEEIINSSTELFHVDHQHYKEFGERIKQAFGRNQVASFEFEVKRKNGEVFPTEHTVSLLKSESGEQIGIVSVFRDISERKRADEAIRFQSEIIGNMAEGVNLVRSSDAMIVYTNPKLDEMFGYDQGELIEKNITVLNTDTKENVDKVAAVIASLNETGTWQGEIENIKKDGTSFWSYCNVSKFQHHEQGEVFISVQTDITERKQVEAELVKHREHLEELVVERTRELKEAHNELVRKEKLATLGQLTATVSHELRNPLGAIRPSMFVIQKRSDKRDEKLQQAIERVDRNVTRCDRIIDELLDFTRTTEIETQATNIDAWLNTTLSDIDIPKGIELVYQPGLGKLELGIDTSRMRRALINIIDNACQAMTSVDNPDQGKEGATLTIATHLNDGRVEIEVTDTGPGIPDDVLPKIFEPLYSTKTFGVGLGMPTIRQIARQHGGDVEIKATNSKGTTVLVWLPQTIQ